MASRPRPADTADFTFRAGTLSTEDLKITRFEGSEGLSELYHFRIDACSTLHDLKLSDLVGKSGLLEVRGIGGTRYVHGIVRQFARTGQGSSLTYYAADLVPVHWLLTRRYRSRIFLESNCPDMTVPGILRKVLTDAGIPGDNVRYALQGDYEAREFVVQYRESEFDFISRLMEHEGIFYFFEHTAEGHKMVIADSPVAHVASTISGTLPFRERSGLLPDQDRESVYELQDAEQIQIGAVSLDDYNFQKPATPLETEVTGETFTSLAFEDYPGDYDVKAVGETYSQVRMEEFQAARRIEHMMTTARGLLPGHKFTLEEHGTQELNGEYLVVRVHHRATQPQSGAEELEGAGDDARYEAAIETIPAATPYRPPRRTPRPTIRGSQTAIVVGPEGEEIYTDKYGRVKVQFHWDREGTHTENSSFWIRVSQGMAGGGYGHMFLPRVGQEVIVDFLEGNPDDPIVTGRVFNGDNMPPYKLPDEKTKSCIKTHSSKGGGGTNEIRFEDLKGEEQLLIQAQRRMDTRAKGSHFHTVGGSYHLHVGGEQDGELKGEYRQLIYEGKHVHVKGDLMTNVDTDESRRVKGKVSIKVDGTHSLDVGGDVVEKFGAGHKSDVTQNFALKAMGIKLEASTGIELVCGGSSIHITPAAIFIKGGPLVNINSGSGPPVMAPMASATAPVDAEDPAVADRTEPGADVTYTKTADDYEDLVIPTLPGSDIPPTEDDKKKTSWIEIQLVDEVGEPVAGEPYEITLPDGKVRKGSTDANGKAKISGIDPGNCRITFPRLDEDAWHRKA